MSASVYPQVWRQRVKIGGGEAEIAGVDVYEVAVGAAVAVNGWLVGVESVSPD